MQKYFISIGALSAAIAVGLGAFGAHGLKAILSPDMLAVWKTGTEYHLIHSIALIVSGILASTSKSKASIISAYLFIAGIIVFCGSLYILSLSGLRWMGAITPLGGLAFIAAWLTIAVGHLKQASNH